LQWPVKGYGASWAIIDTAAAVPAFIRMQNDRRLTFFRVWDKDIYLAVLHTGVTASTDFGIVYYRVTGADNIGVSIYFFSRHDCPPYYFL
jgi:hypothetical protein